MYLLILAEDHYNKPSSNSVGHSKKCNCSEDGYCTFEDIQLNVLSKDEAAKICKNNSRNKRSSKQ
jgi:hypothetical protein